MFEVILDRIAENIRRMPTRELLDRLTAYRAGMQPEAIIMMEQELEQRGVSRETIAAHETAVNEVALSDAHGCAHSMQQVRTAGHRPMLGLASTLRGLADLARAILLLCGSLTACRQRRGYRR